ncbi:M48 family metallopeptidase [Myxococcota bacterium]|nr:M48 family metallopeptidase [Myxococcota bacterium]
MPLPKIRKLNHSTKQFAVLLSVSSCLACASRVPVPSIEPHEARAIESSIQCPDLREIEWSQNVRFGQIALEDPDIKAGATGRISLEKPEHQDNILAFLEAFYEETQVAPTQLARLDPNAIRSAAASLNSSEQVQAYDAIADTSENIQRPIHRRIQRVGMRVARSSDFPDISVSPIPGVMNAFAPIEFDTREVFVGTEIALLAQTDDELACVIGHEIAHVTEGHTTSGAWVNTGKRTLEVLVAVAAAAAAAGSQNQPLSDQQIQGAANLGSMARFLVADVPVRISGWNRGQENEADAMGTHYAARAGFDPSACALLMARMNCHERANGADDGIWWWKTHPVTTERILRIKKPRKVSEPRPALKTRDNAVRIGISKAHSRHLGM